MRESSEVFKHVIAKMIEIWKQLGVPESKIQERFIAATSQNKVKSPMILFKFFKSNILIGYCRSDGDLCLRVKKSIRKKF